LTTTLPVVVLGTVTVMLSADQFVTVAVTPLNVTVPDPCVAANPLPVMVTEVPAVPNVGFNFAIVGIAGLASKVTFAGFPGPCEHDELAEETMSKTDIGATFRQKFQSEAGHSPNAENIGHL